MHTTAINQGDTQVVRIPQEMAFQPGETELEIERHGDELRIRPARRSLAGVLSKFARFSDDFMEAGREPQEQRDRDQL